MATPTQSTSPLNNNNIFTVLTKSLRIINAPAGTHFLDLSVVFLLPLAFFLSSIIYPSLLDLLLLLLIHPKLSSTFPSPPKDPAFTSTALSSYTLFVLFIIVSSLVAVGSITHSACQCFHGRPVNLVSAILSGFASLPSLLGTFFVSQLVVLVVFKAFALFLFLVVRGAQLMGFPVDSSPYFTGFAVAVAVGLLMVLLYLELHFTLAYVVVVVESTWGFDSLIRSARLVMGTRGIAASLMLCFGFYSAVLGCCSWVFELELNRATTGGWEGWAVTLLIGLTTVLLMLLMLYHTVAKTVLYLHCNAEEFGDGGEYVHLLLGGGDC